MIRRRLPASVSLPSLGQSSARRRPSAAPTLWICLFATATLLAPTLAAGAATAEQGWSRAGDMNAGREFFPAVTLQSGKVLVASGSTAELFDPVSETFNGAGALTVDRGLGLSATRLQNGTVLLVGGQTGDSSLASAELYDPGAGTFTPTGDMSDPRSFHSATLLADGRVLIVGGHRFNFRNSALVGAEIYDPATGTFSSTGGMSNPRESHTATLLPDGRVLVAGGYDPDGASALATAELFDPGTGTFAATGSLASGRGNHTGTLLGDGTVLIAGGHAGFPGVSLASAELYDPASGTFASTGNMTDVRGAQSATLLANGSVLIAGGFTEFPFAGWQLASAEIYDPGAGNFTPTASMHAARARHAAASLPNGDVLVAGGWEGTRSAEVFSLARVDTRPPTITTPGEVTGIASGPEGGAVDYTVSAADNIDDNPQLACEPPSGSTFPIGATTVTCTATDSSGNTSTASFTVLVLTPLDIGLSLDRSGSANKKTGVASVSGSVTCNRSTHVFISGELKQTVANRAQIDGFFSTELECSGPAVAWRATVTPITGRFNAGNADAIVFASACNQFSSCDSAGPIAQNIKLAGR